METAVLVSLSRRAGPCTFNDGICEIGDPACHRSGKLCSGAENCPLNESYRHAGIYGPGINYSPCERLLRHAALEIHRRNSCENLKKKEKGARGVWVKFFFFFFF